jgi:hypothetical protein
MVGVTVFCFGLFMISISLLKFGQEQITNNLNQYMLNEKVLINNQLKLMKNFEILQSTVESQTRKQEVLIDIIRELKDSEMNVFKRFQKVFGQDPSSEITKEEPEKVTKKEETKVLLELERFNDLNVGETIGKYTVVGSYLTPGETLEMYQCLASNTGYYLCMQDDGNLVFYHGKRFLPAYALWSTNTHETSYKKLVIEEHFTPYILSGEECSLKKIRICFMYMGNGLSFFGVSNLGKIVMIDKKGELIWQRP